MTSVAERRGTYKDLLQVPDHRVAELANLSPPPL
jgi:hypothetical protein